MGLKDIGRLAFWKIYAFIPNRLSNSMFVKAMEFLRWQQRILKRDFSVNFSENEKKFLSHRKEIWKSQGFIEDQNNYADMAYGKTTISRCGCGILATYNAIFSMTGKKNLSLSKMIAEYEKDGMLFSGRFGTTPKAIRDFLQRYGFQTEFETDENKFDALAEKSQSLILTMYNDRNDIRKEIHTVNISKKHGKYTVHNVYGNGKVLRSCESFRELMEQIHEGNAKGIALIGILKSNG